MVSFHNASGRAARVADVEPGTMTGRPLDPAVLAHAEPRFGQDFSQVRVHTDGRAAESAAGLGALAYTVGRDVVFGHGQYQPHTGPGRELIAHELAHVVQQGARPGGRPEIGAADTVHEAAADRAASAVAAGRKAPRLAPAGPRLVQRKIEMRDVGSGDQSGFARLPELVDRLNAMATGGTFVTTPGGVAAHRVRDDSGALVPGQQTVELRYAARPDAAQTFFETRMAAFITDESRVIPLRLTNRHGLLGNPVAGFHTQVDVDAWQSGYVDIDDLLASSDLGLQSVLLHFLTERGATNLYARRIGGTSLNFPAAQHEFQVVHGRGITAEAELLQDFFGDPTIRIVNDSPSPSVRRVFRNSRRDLIRRRVTHRHGAESGVDASTIEVTTHDGRNLTAEEYRDLLQRERAAAAH